MSLSQGEVDGQGASGRKLVPVVLVKIIGE